MAHFAKVDQGIVTEVLVADQAFIDSYVDNTPGKWIQTSYNTYGGVHYNRNTNPITPSEDQSKALRKNYGGVGMLYDEIKDAFYQPQPYPSWILNDTTYLWESPTPYPSDGKNYDWNETSKSWEEIT